MMKQFEEDWAAPFTYANKEADCSDDWVSLFLDQSLGKDIQNLESGFMNLDSSILQEFCSGESDDSRGSERNTSAVSTCQEQSPLHLLPESFENRHPFSGEMVFSSSQDWTPETMPYGGPISPYYPQAASEPIPSQNLASVSTFQPCSSPLVCWFDGSLNVEPPDGSLVSLTSLSSTLTKTKEKSASASAGHVSGLAQSSIGSISSQQDFRRDEDIDAMIFVDQALMKDSCELKEEIATSKVNAMEEKRESIPDLEQKRDYSMKKRDVETVSRVKEREQRSNSSCGVESTEPQVMTAVTSPGKKRLGKRKIVHVAQADQQSDQSDAGQKSENGELEEDGEKRQARLMRNRESAQLSRQRKKVYVTELEEKVRVMMSTIAELNNTIGLITAENVSLRSQLAHLYQVQGLFPKAGVPPAGFPAGPGTSYAGFTVGMQPFPGFRAPSVPIPRLKSQGLPKSSKSSKSAASKDSTGGRRKRLVGVAAIGFCLIMMIFAPLNSNILGGGSHRTDSILQTPRNQVTNIGGRVLMSINRDENSPNRSQWNRELGLPWDTSTGKILGSGRKQEVDTRHENSNRGKERNTNVEGLKDFQNPAVDCCFLVEQYRNDSAVYRHSEKFHCNNTGALAASLIVPRNNKLIRIDGSLIIQAVMAGDKAAESIKKKEAMKEPSAKSGRVKSVAGQSLPVVVNSNALKAVAGTPLDTSGSEGSRRRNGLAFKNQKALPSKHKVSSYDVSSMPNPDTSDSLQQWLLSDFAGTILSTGTCVEVFQFEISPVPGMSETNETSNSGGNITSPRKSQMENSLWSQRKLGSPMPLPPARHSTGRKHVPGTLQEENTQESGERVYQEQENQSERIRPSSMVVSVLSESHQFGEGKGKTSSSSKGASNFFVVVLIDSIKYVTYSCMLPTQGPHPQLVTG